MEKGMMDRRGFLVGSSVTLAGTVMAVSGGTMLLGPNAAWALSTKVLSVDEAALLIKMARATYPHDSINDAIYAKVVGSLDMKAAANPGLLKMLREGVAGLVKKAFATRDEAGQVAHLKEIEDTPFFQTVRGECITGIYNNPDVWKTFGYEGSSAEFGGYIDRGFNDINWL